MKINVSFRDNNEDDKKLIEFLKEKSKYIGASGYIKQLLYEKMKEDSQREK